jgi:hypothetical protein
MPRKLRIAVAAAVLTMAAVSVAVSSASASTRGFSGGSGYYCGGGAVAAEPARVLERSHPVASAPHRRRP